MMNLPEELRWASKSLPLKAGFHMPSLALLVGSSQTWQFSARIEVIMNHELAHYIVYFIAYLVIFGKLWESDFMLIRFQGD